MKTIKIKLSTTNDENTRYKRNIAPREAFVDLDLKTKTVCLKHGSYKWKPFDTTISRKKDPSYIQGKKQLYSGLCFTTQRQAKEFMANHKKELDQIALNYPTFNRWTLMNVAEKFNPNKKITYGKDYIE